MTFDKWIKSTYIPNINAGSVMLCSLINNQFIDNDKYSLFDDDGIIIIIKIH